MLESEFECCRNPSFFANPKSDGFSGTFTSDSDFRVSFWKAFFHHSSHGWLVGWGLTALLTQNRSYRACKFVDIFHRSKL